MSQTEEFWSEFRRRLSQWEEKLESLNQLTTNATSKETSSNDEHDDTLPATNHQLHDGSAIQSLHELSTELSLLKRHCLSSATSGPVFEEWAVPMNLPNADVRILHEAFTKATTELEGLQLRLVPKGKFIFRRYRKALASRAFASSLTPIPTSDQPSQPTPNTASAVTMATKQTETTLHGHSDSDIVVSVDGSVSINGVVSERRCESPCLSIRGVTTCSITIHFPLQTLYLQNLQDTRIVISNPIASSIHMTQCQGCTLTCLGQQLRIHESRQLELHIGLRAGAILEASQQIVFFMDKDKDIKDFSWLHAGTPSPNFEVRPPLPTTEASNSAHKIEEKTTKVTESIENSLIDVPLGRENENSAVAHNISDDDHDDDDDDDEI